MLRSNRVAVVAAFAALTLGTFAAPVAAGAPAPAVPAPAAPAAPTYTVKPGDNLIGISRKLGVKLAELLAANSMTVTSAIHPGDTLVVPATATNPNAGAAPAPSQTEATGGVTVPPAATAPAAAATATYTVKPGDYLFGIAKAYGIKLGALLKLNNLKITSVVHPGTTLIVPAGGPVEADEVSPSSSPSIAASPIDTVVAYARAQLGKPYKFNTSGPDSFDCSGLTAAAYEQISVYLPHQSAMQSTKGVAVDWWNEPIQAGDLVFMFNSSQPTVIGHVGIAISSTQWIHAPRAGDVVRLGMLPADAKIQAVRRFVTG